MSARDLAPPLRKWSWLGGRAPKIGVSALFASAWLTLLGAPACSTKEPLPAARSGPGSNDLDPAELCATPNQGCPCDGVVCRHHGQGVEGFVKRPGLSRELPGEAEQRLGIAGGSR